MNICLGFFFPCEHVQTPAFIVFSRPITPRGQVRTRDSLRPRPRKQVSATLTNGDYERVAVLLQYIVSAGKRCTHAVPHDAPPPVRSLGVIPGKVVRIRTRFEPGSDSTCVSKHKRGAERHLSRKMSQADETRHAGGLLPITAAILFFQPSASSSSAASAVLIKARNQEETVEKQIRAGTLCR
jgi:hypothetical protein